MYTFAISQYGERLLNRNSPYTYANVTVFIVKRDSNGTTLVGHKYSRQERDTYIEVTDLEAGTYFMYVDVDWQPLTLQEMPKETVKFSINSYGVGDVKFERDSAPGLSQNETLDEILTAYCAYHIENETGDVKVDVETYAE